MSFKHAFQIQRVPLRQGVLDKHKFRGLDQMGKFVVVERGGTTSSIAAAERASDTLLGEGEVTLGDKATVWANLGHPFVGLLKNQPAEFIKQSKRRLSVPHYTSSVRVVCMGQTLSVRGFVESTEDVN